MKIKSIKRTGNTHSITSSEYEIIFSDGTTGNIWSPPWHEMTEQEEDAKALEYAEEIAKNRKPVSKFIQLSVYDALENEACKNCDPADFPKCGNCLGV